jgi:hypothetical protein
MRLRPGVDLEELRYLVHREHELSRRCDLLRTDYSARDWAAYKSSEAYHESQGYWDLHQSEFVTIANEVDAAIDKELTESDDFPLVFRTYPVTYNELFPPEWRLSAQRTILPDELPSLLTEWQDFVASVKRGMFRSYLLALFCHHVYREVDNQWFYLKAAAEDALGRTNAWAVRPECRDACRKVMDLPEPLFVPVPVWEAWRSRTAPDPEKERLWSELSAFAENLDEHRRAYNVKARVHQRFDMERWRGGFDGYLDNADDPWLHEFFAWVQRCCEEDMGLYLWD